MKVSFNEAVGAGLAAIGANVVAYAALFQGSKEALIAMIAVLSAAVGYFLRGKLQPPSGPGGLAA